MHPLVPPEQLPPHNPENSSLEHPLTHGLHFSGPPQGGPPPFPPDGSMHPQLGSVSGAELTAPPPFLAAPHLVPFGHPTHDLKSVGTRRSSHSSGSSFSSRSVSSSGSRSSRSRSGSSSSGSHSGKRKGKGRRRTGRRRGSSEAPLGGSIFNQNPNVQSMLMGPGMPPPSMPLDGFHPNAGRGNFPGGQLYGYPSPILGHQQPPMSGPLGHPQFGGMLSSMSGLPDPSGYGGPAMFPGPRGAIRPGFHTGGGARFMVEGSAPHLADETLQTYPNAAAAPNRLPAHKPVRLTQPKHPLAPPGTPVSFPFCIVVLRLRHLVRPYYHQISLQVYFKYGEEHYPEETVPPEYTFTETDGTVCRYITNFLVYNKRGERLLPIEVLVR